MSDVYAEDHQKDPPPEAQECEACSQLPHLIEPHQPPGQGRGGEGDGEPDEKEHHRLHSG